MDEMTLELRISTLEVQVAVLAEIAEKTATLLETLIKLIEKEMEKKNAEN